MDVNKIKKNIGVYSRSLAVVNPGFQRTNFHMGAIPNIEKQLSLFRNADKLTRSYPGIWPQAVLALF